MCSQWKVPRHEALGHAQTAKKHQEDTSRGHLKHKLTFCLHLSPVLKVLHYICKYSKIQKKNHEFQKKDTRSVVVSCSGVVSASRAGVRVRVVRGGVWGRVRSVVGRGGE